VISVVTQIPFRAIITVTSMLNSNDGYVAVIEPVGQARVTASVLNHAMGNNQ
jgi:hypothetical protein